MTFDSEIGYSLMLRFKEIYTSLCVIHCTFDHCPFQVFTPTIIFTPHFLQVIEGWVQLRYLLLELKQNILFVSLPIEFKFGINGTAWAGIASILWVFRCLSHHSYIETYSLSVSGTDMAADACKGSN